MDNDDWAPGPTVAGDDPVVREEGCHERGPLAMHPSAVQGSVDLTIEGPRSGGCGVWCGAL